MNLRYSTSRRHSSRLTRLELHRVLADILIHVLCRRADVMVRLGILKAEARSGLRVATENELSSVFPVGRVIVRPQGWQRQSLTCQPATQFGPSPSGWALRDI